MNIYSGDLEGRGDTTDKTVEMDMGEIIDEVSSGRDRLGWFMRELNTELLDAGFDGNTSRNVQKEVGDCLDLDSAIDKLAESVLGKKLSSAAASTSRRRQAVAVDYPQKCEYCAEVVDGLKLFGYFTNRNDEKSITRLCCEERRMFFKIMCREELQSYYPLAYSYMTNAIGRAQETRKIMLAGTTIIRYPDVTSIGMKLLKVPLIYHGTTASTVSDPNEPARLDTFYAFETDASVPLRLGFGVLVNAIRTAGFRVSLKYAIRCYTTTFLIGDACERYCSQDMTHLYMGRLYNSLYRYYKHTDREICGFGLIWRYIESHEYAAAIELLCNDFGQNTWTIVDINKIIVPSAMLDTQSVVIYVRRDLTVSSSELECSWPVDSIWSTTQTAKKLDMIISRRIKTNIYDVDLTTKMEILNGQQIAPGESCRMIGEMLRSEPREKRLFISASLPGAGKTEYALRLANILGGDCMVITFTNLLVRNLAKRIAELGYKFDTQTVHKTIGFRGSIPTKVSKYKVIVIDEWFNLSISAQSALIGLMIISPGITWIATGDPNQLDPIENKDFVLTREERFEMMPRVFRFELRLETCFRAPGFKPLMTRIGKLFDIDDVKIQSSDKKEQLIDTIINICEDHAATPSKLYTNMPSGFIGKEVRSREEYLGWLGGPTAPIDLMRPTNNKYICATKDEAYKINLAIMHLSGRRGIRDFRQGDMLIYMGRRGQTEDGGIADMDIGGEEDDMYLATKYIRNGQYRILEIRRDGFRLQETVGGETMELKKTDVDYMSFQIYIAITVYAAQGISIPGRYTIVGATRPSAKMSWFRVAFTRCINPGDITFLISHQRYSGDSIAYFHRASYVAKLSSHDILLGRKQNSTEIDKPYATLVSYLDKIYEKSLCGICQSEPVNLKQTTVLRSPDTDWKEQTNNISVLALACPTCSMMPLLAE